MLAPDELQWIIEEGFPFTVNDHSPNMSTEAVVLSNSIGLADMRRLQVLFPREIVHTPRINVAMRVLSCYAAITALKISSWLSYASYELPFYEVLLAGHCRADK